MADQFRLTMAQLNPTVGDLAGHAAKARAAWHAGRAAGAHMAALPQLLLTRYPAQHLPRPRGLPRRGAPHRHAQASA